jgi:hypothetical protein
MFLKWKILIHFYMKWKHEQHCNANWIKFKFLNWVQIHWMEFEFISNCIELNLTIGLRFN